MHRITSTRLWRGSTMSTGLREECVFRHPSVTFVTWTVVRQTSTLLCFWKGCRRCQADLSWRFTNMAGRSAMERRRSSSMGTRPKRSSVWSIAGTDAAERRHHVAESLHLPHSGSSDTDGDVRRGLFLSLKKHRSVTMKIILPDSSFDVIRKKT